MGHLLVDADTSGAWKAITKLRRGARAVAGQHIATNLIQFLRAHPNRERVDHGLPRQRHDLADFA